jgi:hypothetical protein
LSAATFGGSDKELPDIIGNADTYYVYLHVYKHDPSISIEIGNVYSRLNVSVLLRAQLRLK